MTKIKEHIKRIENHYVGEDCVQYMLPYKNSLALFNPNDIMYYHKPGINMHINNYLKDERRKQFPYSNIPFHKEKYFFTKYRFTNQLFNFETPYTSIEDGKIVERFVVKDNKGAFIIKKELSQVEKEFYMTKKEVENLFKPSYNRQLYIMNLNGCFYEKEELLLPTEELMVEWLKENLRNQLKKYEKKVQAGEISSYLNEVALEYFEKSIDKATISDLPDYISNLDDDIIVIELNGDNIIVKDITIRYMSHNKYKVYITNMPIYKFSLEQLKFLSRKIHRIREPKFPLRINHGISKEEVENAKEFVKKLKV